MNQKRIQLKWRKCCIKHTNELEIEIQSSQRRNTVLPEYIRRLEAELDAAKHDLQKAEMN